MISSVVLLAINVGSSMMTQNMINGRMNDLIRVETEAKLSNLASAQAGAIQARFDRLSTRHARWHTPLPCPRAVCPWGDPNSMLFCITC
ncbi:hypothetical protein [Paludibacterium denitrificans]|uniref:hypothetical protein n=1 Tax=Paludibacterium denitrificans TaxID=2675226 RepID=UPI001E3A4CF7|nr:hypothetical protein [Paludibacterium denitrificans]